MKDILYADEAILGAFFKLVKKKTTDQITCIRYHKNMPVSREALFIIIIRTSPLLYLLVEEKTIHDVFSIMEKFHPENDHDICQSYFLTICRYTMENPFLSSLLSTPHGNDLFEKMLTMLHHYVTATTSSARPGRHTKEEISYVITCAIGSTIGVLHKWTRDNFDLAPEVIAGILTQIFLSGMLPLFILNALHINRHNKNPSEKFTQTGFLLCLWLVDQDILSPDFLCRAAYKRIFPDHQACNTTIGRLIFIVFIQKFLKL